MGCLILVIDQEYSQEKFNPRNYPQNGALQFNQAKAAGGTVAATPLILTSNSIGTIRLPTKGQPDAVLQLTGFDPVQNVSLNQIVDLVKSDKGNVCATDGTISWNEAQLIKN